MFKPAFILAILISCVSSIAWAQSDSSQYDLGRISVKKKFTQTITVKASDLERYQFSNLGDAINVWYYGTYSSPTTLVYVIDGNILIDVNAYSIYDVDEITLVQNALTVVSGVSPDQQMVLIKLKTGGPGKQGFEVNGQTSLVNMRTPPNSSLEKASASLYDQYYISGYKNFDNIKIGFSIDYQRDVVPGAIMPGSSIYAFSYNSFTPPNYNRFKLTGYADINLFTGSLLSIRLNYVPEVYTSSENYTGYNVNPDAYLGTNTFTQGDNNRYTQHVINASMALKSQIFKGLNNTLSLSYSHDNSFQNDNSQYAYNQDSNAIFYSQTGTYHGKYSNLLIRDNLTYHQQLGDFNIEPSLNLSTRYVRDSFTSNLVTASLSTASANNYYGNNNIDSNYYSSTASLNYQLYLLSPALNLYYKDIFNLQGGVVDILNPDGDFDPNFHLTHLYPFITTSIDAGKLLKFANISFHIFGSYSRQSQLVVDTYSSIYDLYETATTPADVGELAGKNGFKNYNNTIGGPNPYSAYNSYQAGAVLAVLKGLTINYNFDYRYYKTFGEVTYDEGNGQTETEDYYYNDKLITNRIGLNYTISSTTYNWRVGINAAETEMQLTDKNNQYNSSYLTEGHRWSGGVTNRFTEKNFFAGLDVLYQFGERPYSLINLVSGIGQVTGNPDYINNNNSISLQNLYVGSQIKIPGLKYAEIYVNGRNILQNGSSTITDNRRYFGFGFKMAK